MIIYLTSDPGGISLNPDGTMKYAPLKKDNSFLSNLKESLKKVMSTENQNSKLSSGGINLLIIAAFPDAFDDNDISKRLFVKAYNEAGIPVNKADICDYRNKELVTDLHEYHVVMLLGGNVQIQNQFINDINLKNKLIGYEGILITISAGSMNSAGKVYALPETKEEATDPDYERFVDGLGLTNIQIIPHFQYLKGVVFDNGMRMLEDIILPDSISKEFVGLRDGSYIFIENNNSRIWGEYSIIRDGKLT